MPPEPEPLNGDEPLLQGGTESSSSGVSAKMSFMRVSSTPGDENGVDESPLLDDDLTTSLVPNGAGGAGGGPDNNNNNNDNEDPRQRYLQMAYERTRWIGPYLATVTMLSMIILVPAAVYRAASLGRVDVGAFDSALVMVLGTVVMSLRLVYLHLTHWHMPDVQKYVVRILWMVPLYSVQSYLSLRFHDARIYIDAIRDFYEAYVIASFVYYLMELLGGQERLVEILQSKDASLGHHKFPFNYVLNTWEMGTEFMLQCKHGALQYVVMKLLATILCFMCQAAGVYGEGEFSWATAYPYMTFVMNFSVMYALYCLVMLFHAVNEELCNPINWRPLGKFLCVKGVVFFTWWQGVVIYYLRAHGIISDIGTWSAGEVANGLIDFCIVFEMVFFAIAHSFTFSYKEYLPSRYTSNLAAAAAASAADTEGGGGGGGEHEGGGAGAEYQPPAIRTLDRPLSFQDAFWSSTVPRETLNDIQRLRGGVDETLARATDPGAISMRSMAGGDDDELESVTRNLV